MRRQKNVLIATSMLLLVAACGGGDDETEADGAGSSEGTTTSSSGTAGSSDAAAHAVVTVAGERWEFDLTGDFAKCVPLGGALGALGPASDGTEVTVAIDLPPVDWQTRTDAEWAPPSVQVNDKVNGRDWRSGDRIAAPLIAAAGLDETAITITDFSIDGESARGSAVFVDVLAVESAAAMGAAPPVPVTGTFEVVCN